MNELDELDALRDLRGGMPPMDPAVRDGIRANLLALADGDASETPPALDGSSRAPRVRDAQEADGLLVLTGDRTPRARRTRRAVLPIAAAVLLTVGIGVGVAAVRETGGTPGGVQAEKYRTPGMHQWVYTRTYQSAGFNMNTWYNGVSRIKGETGEFWSRVDGGGYASIGVKGNLEVSIFDQGSNGSTVLHSMTPPKRTNRIAGYERLPTDPEALYRSLRVVTLPQKPALVIDANVFESAQEMLQVPLPPGLRTALYRMLPLVKEVVVRPGITDFAGRRGDGFSITTNGGDRKTVIIDPVTHRLLGTAEDAVADYRSGRDLVKKGTLLFSKAVIVNKIVDQAGQR